MNTEQSADTVRPPGPDFTRRIVAFATALGVTPEHFFTLLESYGLGVIDTLYPQRSDSVAASL